MANYGWIGLGLDGFEGPRGSNCKTSSLDHSSSCNVLQLTPSWEEVTKTKKMITRIVERILLLEEFMPIISIFL